VQQAAAQSLDELIKAQGGTWPPEIGKPEHLIMEQAVAKLTGLGVRKYATLSAWLEKSLATEIDVKKLRDFGADLTTEAEEGRLARAYGVDGICEELEKVLLRGQTRAAVLLGEAGVGKTAIVQELTHRIRKQGWRVLRFSPVELLAGTKYLGEWQTKLNDMVRAVKAPRKVILYCPNLQELSDAGRTSVSDINMATALAPRVEAGEIAILGESTSEAFRAGLGAIGSLRRLFHGIEVTEADAGKTRDVLAWLQREAKANVPPKVLDRLL
jgi:ATP-dependent Clp protease ATP-binding subunit ClpA